MTLLSSYISKHQSHPSSALIIWDKTVFLSLLFYYWVTFAVTNSLKKHTHIILNSVTFLKKCIWLCRILVAARGIFWLQHVGSSSLTRDEPRPPALEAQSLSHWTTREVSLLGILTKKIINQKFFIFNLIKIKNSAHWMTLLREWIHSHRMGANICKSCIW